MKKDPQEEQTKEKSPESAQKSFKKLKDSTDNYAKYMGAGIQIVAPVVLGVLVGLWLDKHFEKETPVFTIALSSLMIVVALYLFIKQIYK